MHSSMHECAKMKDKIKRVFKDRKYYVYRNCALEDVMRDNNDYACKDCKYNCISRCMVVGLMVLK